MTDTIYSRMAKKFGEVSFEGREYALLAQATLTNRCFPGSWSDATEGEEYISEWSAPAVGQDEEEYVVRWHFTLVKGEEPEDDSDLDWGSVYTVITA